MSDLSGETLRDILSTVRPYLAFPSDLEESIEEVSEESSDLKEFEKGLVELISKEEDPSKKADFRIFLNELRRR
ncbi:hypothetical protein AKJ57_03945 [candidate division MSBL1 archaeon SCGC-AAA259A05]|uniref:Uncharacterized protein n=1 Tax=candidate division MSBL1 archaeon SCGC-AAA259A05 TaxID=1698259 RepID=A0A133U977_9EURY|nr:hypothetical protein AKJ57_03945 [candidate division MSBL1 archaeon SCGC-AAA259A05]